MMLIMKLGSKSFIFDKNHTIMAPESQGGFGLTLTWGKIAQWTRA